MKTAFGQYELLRMLVPGFYFGVVSLLFLWSVRPYVPAVETGVEVMVVIFLFLSFSAGLTMYLRETPKRRKAFLENQPSAVIQNMARTMKGVEALSDDDARRIYFHLLNTAVPLLAHEKVFFFGTVYHIVVHVRRTTFWFAIISTALLSFFFAADGMTPETHNLTLFSLSVWAMYALNVRYNKADRNMQENYHDQIVWLEMNRGVVEKILREWKRSM